MRFRHFMVRLLAVAAGLLVLIGLAGIAVPYLRNHVYYFADSYAYSSGNGTIAAADIHSISVRWLGGSISILPCDGDEIRFSEVSPLDISDDIAMRYFITDGSLKIEYRQSGFQLATVPLKYLQLEIPRALLQSGLTTLRITTGNTPVHLTDLTVENLQISTSGGAILLSRTDCTSAALKTAGGAIYTEDCHFSAVQMTSESGNLTCKRLNSGNVSMVTDSGDCLLNGTIAAFSAKTTSGDITFLAEESPYQIQADTYNGSVRIGLQRAEGFTALFDTVSGTFSSIYETVPGQKGSYIYGSGSALFSLKSTSGSVSIEKYDPASEEQIKIPAG